MSCVLSGPRIVSFPGACAGDPRESGNEAGPRSGGTCTCVLATADSSCLCKREYAMVVQICREWGVYGGLPFNA